MHDMCLLYRSCDDTTECTNCITEDMGCFDRCSSPYVGNLNENVLEIIPNTKSEFQCKEACSFDDNCIWYTYYFANDTMLPEFCFLLSDWGSTVADCPTCVTGASECKETRTCELLVEGETRQSLMLVDTGRDHNVSVVSYGGRCSLRVFAVGGGGSGGNSAGGGSGYLNYFTTVLPPVTSPVKVRVGGGSGASKVTIYGQTFSAPPGQNGENGGAGYSGGGGSCSCNGGSNGTIGPNNWWNGGQGTGEDITQYTLTDFNLSPGIGGEYTPYSLYSCGGGGGGALVNGDGPQHSSKQGAGYGGGGSGDGYADSDRGGIKGVVIMEIV